MSEHYFTQKPTVETRPEVFTAVLKGREYLFRTDAGVFSKKEVDRGTQILINKLNCRLGETVLDLGCGYGPIDMVDVNERAVELARANLKLNEIYNATVLVSDGLEALPGKTFDWVVSNPPIRTGKKVVYPLLKSGYDALRPGGCLLVVIRTKQGAKSLEAYLKELAGNCETVERISGYRVLKCCKLPPA